MARLLGMLALATISGCAPAGGEAENMTAYEHSVLANTACHRASDHAQVRRDGARLILTRTLIREPGLCAQAITKVVFSGEFPKAEDGVEAYVLEIVDQAGRVLETKSWPS